MVEKTKIKDLTFSELEHFFISIGEKKFRARQLYEWLYVHNCRQFSEMENLPKKLREKLAESCELNLLEHENSQVSPDGQTQKFLLRLRDGYHIESVLMHSKHGRTLCVSTQVGCPVDCQFCATGLMGLHRNLSAGEILEQVLLVEHEAKLTITNIVVMGMGEPFLNYDNLMQALQILTDDHGKNMARQHIVISTSGILPRIEQFIAERQRYRLAISLNAPTDTQREKIMPLNKKWSIKSLLQAARKYAETGRNRITFEYVLLQDINDRPADARQLISLLQGINCKLNLIPFNTTYSIYKRPEKAVIEAFYAEFRDVDFPVTIRWSRGTDIDAACGQLVTREGEKPLRNEIKRSEKIAGAKAGR